MAFVPHAMNIPINDSFDSQLMEIEDGAGIVNWRDFVGATILRTIVHFTFDTTVGQFDLAGDAEAHSFGSIGFGLTDDETPEVAQWDPNRPHAEFMWRDSYSFHYISRETFNGGVVGFTDSTGSIIRADSTQRRRIREGQQMWAFVRGFERVGGATDISNDVGYTGRVLIQLP